MTEETTWQVKTTIEFKNEKKAREYMKRSVDEPGEVTNVSLSKIKPEKEKNPYDVREHA